MKLRGGLVGGVVASLIFIVSQNVQAQPSPENQSAAEALFVGATKLMEEGKYEQACAKFRKSQELDPGVGTVLNLARCYAKQGRTASAWSTYRHAASLARKDGQTEREGHAREQSDLLEPRLTRLRVVLDDAVRSLSGLSVTREGVEVSGVMLDEALPVDPGEITIQVAADGYETKSFAVEATEEGRSYEIRVESLEVAEEATTTDEGPRATTAEADEPEVDEPLLSRDRSVGPYVLGGAGLVSLGVGTAFAFVAKSHDNEARSICEDETAACTESDVSKWETQLTKARSRATVAYLGWGIGGAALASAVAWWILDQPTSTANDVGVTWTPKIDPAFCGLFAEGKF